MEQQQSKCLTINEIWKPIPEYPLYEASNLGHIRYMGFLVSVHYCHGYPEICIHNDYNKKQGVHRLVLMAFVGPCPKGCEASHLDGNKDNNNISNLVWETHADNNERKSKISKKDALDIQKMWSDGYSIIEIAKIYDVDRSYVSRVCHNARNKYSEYRDPYPHTGRDKRIFSEEEIIEIVNMHKEGKTENFIREKFRASGATIRRVIRENKKGIPK